MVPKFYLRGFCAPGSERLWVGDIRTQKVYPAHVSDVGVVKDIYAGDSGPHEDELEERLAEIEGNAAPELRDFLAGDSDVEENLTRFIGWLAARTMWLRRMTQENLPTFIRTNKEVFREIVGQEIRPFDFEHLSSGRRERLPLGEALSRIDDPSWQLRVTQDQHLDAIRMQAHLFQTQHFPTLKWLRARAPSGYSFITSDRPVCWNILDAGVGDSPAALRHPFAELTVPLGKHCALVAGHGTHNRGWNVNEINERTCDGAERFIYGHSEGAVSLLMQRRRGDSFH